MSIALSLTEVPSCNTMQGIRAAMEQAQRVCRTLCVGAFGAILAHCLGLPTGLLSGAVAAVAIFAGADVRRVALMQTMRLAPLMIFIPLLANQALGVFTPKQAPHEILTLFELFGFIGACTLAALVAKPLGVPSQIWWLL